MFVDRVKIFVKGGDGGRGCVSFRREPYVPRGGPDGGNGGRGGDVVLLAVSHQNTLLPLRYHTEFRAERGEHGGPGNRTGASGGELVVPVPPGTAARPTRPRARSWARSCRTGDRLLVARGGPRGTREPILPLQSQPRPPRGRSRGRAGEERWLRLDLRLIADVGPAGRAQRRQVHAALPAVRGPAQDRRLSLHHPPPGARGRGVRRAHVRARRHPGDHRGRSRGGGAGPPVPPARGADPRASCTWWTPRGPPAAIR